MGNNWVRCTQRQSYNKLSPLAESNRGNKWGRHTQRTNYRKLSPLLKVTGIRSGVATPKDRTVVSYPLAKSNCGNKWGRYTQKLSPLAKNMIQLENLDNNSFSPYHQSNCCSGKQAGLLLKTSKMVISGYLFTWKFMLKHMYEKYWLLCKWQGCRTPEVITYPATLAYP